MFLDEMPYRAEATVVSVDWDALTPGEGRRLREFGLDEGVAVSIQHRATFGGTFAYRIGRMNVALRSHVARAIRVEAAPAK